MSYHGGRGVGRYTGEASHKTSEASHKTNAVVFVAGTAPGDLAEVRITEKHKNFWVGEVVELIRPGPSRVDPPCPVFGVCGGCSWQHIHYEEQLRQKQKILQSAFRNLQKNFAIPAIPEIVPSPQEYRYRNRIQIQRIGSRVGYFQPQSHNLVEIDDCLIAEADIAQSIQAVASSPLPQHNPPKKYQIARSLRGTISVAPVGIDRSEAFFSQVNSLQNEALIEFVTRTGLQALPSAATVLDLYCGNGNFSIPLAKRFTKARVLGVELSKRNVEIAQREAKESNLESLEFFARDVEKFLREPPAFARPLLAIVDPPRTGLEKAVVTQLCQLKADALVYISCQPMTLARDLEPLINSGYEIVAICGFDMFPQTAHVETVVQMRRPKS